MEVGLKIAQIALRRTPISLPADRIAASIAADVVGIGGKKRTSPKTSLAQKILKLLVQAYGLKTEDYKTLASILKDKDIFKEIGVNPDKIRALIEEYKALLKKVAPDGKAIFLSTKNAQGLEMTAIRTVAIKNILVSKYTNSQKYERMLKLLKLTENGTIPPYIIANMSTKGDLSPIVKKDINKLIQEKPIVETFESKNQALHHAHVGEVVETDKKLFVREETGLTELEMDKETYLKLFPPVTRYAHAQGGVENCAFLSVLNAAMSNPKQRANLYKLFRQDGDDIVVTLPGYPKFPRIFKNGQMRLPEKTTPVRASLGIKMLEQAHAVAKFFQEKAHLFKAGEHLDLDDAMQNIAEGNFTETVGELWGNKKGKTLLFLKTQKEIKAYNDLKRIIRRDGQKPPLNVRITKRRTVEIALAKYANNPDYILTTTTPRTMSSGTITKNSDYNLSKNHAYTIIKADPTKKIVTICNPWNTSEWIEISYDKFFSYFSSLGFLKVTN